MSTVFKIRTPQELKRAYKNISDSLQKPFHSTRRLFVQLGVVIDRDAMLTFRNDGAYHGRMKWIDFGKGKGIEYYRNKNGTFKKRRGTDGAKNRRYSESSKLLRASGLFMQSFKILKIGSRSMHYGTNHKFSKEIMSNPKRNVLHVTQQDKKDYYRIIRGWYKKGLGF